IRPFVISVLMLLLVACQQNDLFDDTISSIEIHKYDELGASDDIITTIKDEDLIDDITTELETARTVLTSDLDIPGPDYWLIFKRDDETVQELGYYTKVKNFNNCKGRYIDFEGDGTHYCATTKISIDGEDS